MSGACSLLNKKPIIGNNVSHSNTKTRKKFDLNLQKKTYHLKPLGEEIAIRVSNHADKTVLNKHGGDLCSFLVNTKDKDLSDKGQALKIQVKRKLTSEQIDSLKKKKEFNPKVKAMKKQPKPRLLKKKLQKEQAE